ncbi:hypothetical protein QCD71_18765 [Sphingomonas sp. PsM26]|nr:hypothetical protein [Sphingomonas sp. PsM26]
MNPRMLCVPMFIMIHFPFVDLRGIDESRLGRSPRPDWRSDDPGQCFVRGFGGMSARNAKAFGLVGERAYVEFEHALAFPVLGVHRQEGWSHGVPLRVWFRRLYFDGDIAGRFEIGFNTDAKHETEITTGYWPPYDLSSLARSVCDISVEVRSSDGSVVASSLERCGEALGLAYLVATTLNSERANHPAAEIMGSAFNVGSPAVHVRARSGTPLALPADRRDVVESGDSDHMFLTSVAKAQRRNTMTVQVSCATGAETAEERARRVLFTHLNSVLHASDFLAATMDARTIARHRLGLKELTSRAIERFGKLAVTAPKTDDDDAFAKALRLFSDEHAGRVDGIVAKLDALAKDAAAPGRLERIGGWSKGWTEFFADSAIKASVKALMAAK